MLKLDRAILGLVVALCSEGWAEDSAIIGAGYQLPGGFNAAPGQVLTVVATGLTAPAQYVSAGSGPWPSTLGGISATLTAETAAGYVPLPVPIGNILPFTNCASPPAACPILTAVTLQVPFEVVTQTFPDPPLRGAVLTLSDQGGHTATTGVGLWPDQVHVLRTNDTIVGRGSGGGEVSLTHADGSPVSLAQPGETLVMYAVGLGATNPAVADGAFSPAASLAFAQVPYVLNFDFTPNAAPKPGRGDRAAMAVPAFAGLTPSFVGLYQVNFAVPVPPAGTPPCAPGVVSNLTVTLVGYKSFDGVSMCVGTGGM